MLARSRGNRGSTTLEAVLLYPALLLGILFLMLFLAGMFRYVLGTLDMTDALRRENLRWAEEGDGLYWDTLEKLGGDNSIQRKTNRLEEKTAPAAVPGDIALDYSYSNPWGDEVELKGTISKPFLAVGSSQYGLQLSFVSRRFLPAASLRNLEFMDREIWKPLLENWGDTMPDNSEDGSDKTLDKVYIIDESEKQHDYLKVFHLHDDCQYVRNKSALVLKKEQALARGFRPCLICLRSDIAEQ